jgi:prepilin peptidase CpaA
LETNFKHMPISTLILNLVLFGVLAVACASDMRTRRIPNWLTFSAAGVGLLLNGVFGGLDGLRDSGQGLGTGLAMLFPLFVLRWMGAGDVKLMAAVGALKGPEFVFYACLWAAVFGGGIALIGLVRSQRLVLALQHLYYSRLMPTSDGTFMKAAWRMPYAPAIALGCCAVLYGLRGIGPGWL